jgi:hypothetical protein
MQQLSISCRHHSAKLSMTSQRQSTSHRFSYDAEHSRPCNFSSPLSACDRGTSRIYLFRCGYAVDEDSFDLLQLSAAMQSNRGLFGRCRATEVGVLKKHLDFVLLQCHTVQSQFWRAVLRLSRSSILYLVFQMRHRVLNTLNFFKQMDVTESNSFREFAVKFVADLELVDPDTISDRQPEARRRHSVAAPLMTEQSAGWPPLVRLGPMTAADSTPEQFPALNDQQIQAELFHPECIALSKAADSFRVPCDNIHFVMYAIIVSVSGAFAIIITIGFLAGRGGSVLLSRDVLPYMTYMMSYAEIPHSLFLVQLLWLSGHTKEGIERAALMNNTIPSRIETLSLGYDGINASAIIESLRSIQLYLNFLVSLDFYFDDPLSFPIVINQSMHALHELLHEAALNEKEAENANQYFPKVLRGVWVAFAVICFLSAVVMVHLTMVRSKILDRLFWQPFLIPKSEASRLFQEFSDSTHENVPINFQTIPKHVRVNLSLLAVWIIGQVCHILFFLRVDILIERVNLTVRSADDLCATVPVLTSSFALVTDVMTNKPHFSEIHDILVSLISALGVLNSGWRTIKVNTTGLNDSW